MNRVHSRLRPEIERGFVKDTGTKNGINYDQNIKTKKSNTNAEKRVPVFYKLHKGVR